MYLDVGGCLEDTTVLSHSNLFATPNYRKLLDESKGEAKQQLGEGSPSSSRDSTPSPNFPIFQCGSPESKHCFSSSVSVSPPRSPVPPPYSPITPDPVSSQAPIQSISYTIGSM